MGLLQRIGRGLVRSSTGSLPIIHPPISSSQGCTSCFSGCGVKDSFEELSIVQRQTLESLKQNTEHFNRAFDHKDPEQMSIHARIIFALIRTAQEQGIQEQARALLKKHLTDDSLNALMRLKS